MTIKLCRFLISTLYRFRTVTVNCADQSVEKEENEGAGRKRYRRSMRKGL
jgi:hypothetical protein